MRKVPPHNLEAEQAVLGGVFLKASVFHELVDIIGEDDFYSPVHKTIFQAFQELFRQNIPIDLVTTAERLGAIGKLEETGGAVYLAELADSTVSASNTLFHAQIVRDKAIQRELIHVAADIIENCFSGGAAIDSLLDESEQSIFKISDARTKPAFIHSKDLVDKVFEELQERVARKELVTGVPTGYEKLDEITAGLQPSDLIIIAGRPSMGKTAFAMNLGMRAAIDFQVPTAVFSLEMSEEQIMMRMLCSRYKVDLTRMRRGFLDDADWNNLYEAAQDLSGAPLYIDDSPALSTLEMRARCRRLKAEKGLGLVIVDYLQLMRASRRIDSREQEISDISRSLKALAKELNVPVVALSQLNRKVEDRPGSKRPILSDLRESGAIEQDADLIAFIYRDELYNKKDDNPNKGIAEVIIRKQRNGPTGLVKLAFLDKSTTFEDLSPLQDVPESEYPSDE
ncbi:MAG: replicative DNA helicase [Thermodesulfobacteriota bacterium]|nr:replicative DNA helicase [Thermodesulfobacteriota bacterium]